MRKTTEGKFLGKLVKSANLVVFQQKTKRGRQDKYGRHLPGAHSRVDLHIRLVVLIPVDDIGVDTQSPGDAFSRVFASRVAVQLRRYAFVLPFTNMCSGASGGVVRSKAVKAWG